jgi:type I restriction enzyme M protein
MPVRNYHSRFFIRSQDRRSPTARRLKSRWSQQLLLANFEDYFNGFTSHVPGTIVDNFKFSYQLTTLSKASAIGAAINNFLDPAPRLSSSSIDNYSMGIPSEKLVPKVNLKNNEEARENQTGRRVADESPFSIFHKSLPPWRPAGRLPALFG